MKKTFTKEKKKLVKKKERDERNGLGEESMKHFYKKASKQKKVGSMESVNNEKKELSTVCHQKLFLKTSRYSKSTKHSIQKDSRIQL